MEKDWWKKHLSEDGRVLDLRGTELTSLEGVDLPADLKELYALSKQSGCMPDTFTWFADVMSVIRAKL